MSKVQVSNCNMFFIKIKNQLTNDTIIHIKISNLSALGSSFIFSVVLYNTNKYDVQFSWHIM
jgi:hypothetical protein